MNPTWRIRCSPRIGLFARILLTWLFCAILYAPAFSLDRDRRIDEFYHTAWTYADGVPGEVHALAQTTDGYLWVGTSTGLVRFDGVRFERFQPSSGLPYRQGNVDSLLATPDGGLWVSYWYGGLSFIHNGKVTNYGEGGISIPFLTAYEFARDRQGVIWAVAGSTGLFRFDGSEWEKIGPDWGYTGRADTVFVDRGGRVWVGTGAGMSFLPEGEKRFQIASRQQLLWVKELREAPDGTLWMAETGRSVRPVPLPSKEKGTGEPEIQVGSMAILFDHEGSLWVTSVGDGIRRIPFPERLGSAKIGQFDSRAEAFAHQNGLTADYLYCILEDREGNIWVGTSGGLDQFRQSAVVSSTLQGGPVIISLVPGEHGALWVVGSDWRLREIQDGKEAMQVAGPDHSEFNNVYRAPNGAMWLTSNHSSSTSFSLYRLADEQSHPIGSSTGEADYRYSDRLLVWHGMTLRRVRQQLGDKFPFRGTDSGGTDRAIKYNVRAITQDRSDRLWLATEVGAMRLDGSNGTSLASLGGPKIGFPAEFTDADGRVWFGFDKGVAMLNGSTVTTFSSKDGVHVGPVTSIEGEGQRIWIGGDFGLEYFDGNRFRQLNPDDGSTFAGVAGIIADPEEGLWFSENRGVMHIPEAELRSLDSRKTVAYQVYDKLDGLTAALKGFPTYPTIAHTSDGRIWFATTKGLVWIDPKQIPKNTVPPPVLIESVLANGKHYDSAAPLNLPPRIKNLQIVYTATSLTVPQRVRFRYRLEGQDVEWQDAETRREASYTNLDPGTYKFQVIACNNDGVWNNTGATLNFQVMPAFNQTAWFKILCGLAAAGCLWLMYLLRLKQATDRIRQRLGARLEERERIARDLHDTLLQSFNGLLLRFQAVSNLLPARPEEAKQRVDSAIEHASNAITEGRDAVHELRSGGLPTIDLAQAINYFGNELLNSPVSENPPEFRVQVEGSPRVLNPIVRDEVYRIATEALRNAIRHAKARRIEVEIHHDEQQLRLRIRDDGKGIDPGGLDGDRSPGHWGLPGMRERATLMGGKFQVWSELDSGTEIELSVPATSAYAMPRATRWTAFWGSSRS